MNTTEKMYRELASMNQPLGVLSTINEKGFPESATVYYIFDKDLNLYFVTREESRKYKNIKHNRHVSFVVSTEKPAKTFQLHGTAHQVQLPYEESSYFADLVSIASKHVFIPPVSQIGDSKMLFVKITPTWMRVGDFSIIEKDDNKFIEVTV
jgi:uncharacterized protein YhbP (UPF0306 family)